MLSRWSAGGIGELRRTEDGFWEMISHPQAALRSTAPTPAANLLLALTHRSRLPNACQAPQPRPLALPFLEVSNAPSSSIGNERAHKVMTLVHEYDLDFVTVSSRYATARVVWFIPVGCTCCTNQVGSTLIVLLRMICSGAIQQSDNS